MKGLHIQFPDKSAASTYLVIECAGKIYLVVFVTGNCKLCLMVYIWWLHSIQLKAFNPDWWIYIKSCVVWKLFFRCISFKYKHLYVNKTHTHTHTHTHLKKQLANFALNVKIQPFLSSYKVVIAFWEIVVLVVVLVFNWKIQFLTLKPLDFLEIKDVSWCS